jgi:hypothetical protein
MILGDCESELGDGESELGAAFSFWLPIYLCPKCQKPRARLQGRGMSVYPSGTNTLSRSLNLETLTYYVSVIRNLFQCQEQGPFLTQISLQPIPKYLSLDFSMN